MAGSLIILAVFLLAVILVGCGRSDTSKPSPTSVGVTQPEQIVSTPTQVPLKYVGDKLPSQKDVVVVANETTNLPAETKAEERTVVYAEQPTVFYNGNAALEERIATADVIAIARMTSVVASVENYNHEGFDGGTSTAQSYVAALKFTFTVSNYLKGSGSSGDSVTAVVKSLWVFGDRAEAQETADLMLAERDTQWDSRDAVIFLVNESKTLPVTATDGIYFMASWDIYTPETGDEYSIASKRNKIWLPEAQRATGGGARASSAEKWFLTDVPTTGSTAQQRSGSQTTDESPAIAQSALVAQITSVNNKLTAQPGRRYKMCVAYQMYFSRVADYRQSAGLGSPVDLPVLEAEIASGQPANTPTGWKTSEFVVNADWQNKIWFEGDAADLFTIGDETNRWDFTFSARNSFAAGGGKFLIKGERIQRHIATTRPLPAGEYTFTEKIRGLLSEPCEGHVERAINILTVTAPAGTLHEAFFDPVTDGSAVAADSTNGILKPASFTDANSASASLQRIEWASGTVKVKVSPHTGLAGHRLDFIELDGSVSLSLNIDAATVDDANNTLSWTVTEQPWHDGDKLMLRIHKAVPAPEGVSVSLSGGTFTVSWSAVTGVTDYRAQYRTGGSEAEWTDLDVTTGTSQTFSPEGGVACGTTYEFRVQGRGNGTTYSAVWGKLSESASHTTEACNRAPVFSSATYSFTVAENTAVWQSVGTVSATDPDEGDSVTYHITAGNGAGRFEISSGSKGEGLILVWGALDYETTSSYTLTVEARDGKQGGTSSATVEITVTDVAE